MSKKSIARPVPAVQAEDSPAILPATHPDPGPENLPATLSETLPETLDAHGRDPRA